MPSRSVISNQRGPHQNLDKTVSRHRASVFSKPYSQHSEQAFEAAQSWLKEQGQRPLILDSCCGVGQSSRLIAAAHPECSVVAVDKSAHRLLRERSKPPSNLLLLRADLNDFYRLADAANWQLFKHFILYPNPWPKSSHLGRRWHGAPVFPCLLALGGELELRSNWRLYLEEFRLALLHYQIKSDIKPLCIDTPLTPFEEKYHRSGQALWQLKASAPSSS